MPPFYKHRSDPSPGEISYPWRKIDEDQLRQYISVSSLENFQQKCNGKFDVSFTAREDSGEVRACLTVGNVFLDYLIAQIELFLV